MSLWLVVATPALLICNVGYLDFRCNLQESDTGCDSERGDDNKSILSSTSDGRWDFAKILKENL